MIIELLLGVGFIEMKMRNPDLPSDKLLKKALKNLVKSSKTENSPEICKKL